MSSPVPKSPEQSEKSKKYDRQLRLDYFDVSYFGLIKRFIVDYGAITVKNSWKMQKYA